MRVMRPKNRGRRVPVQRNAVHHPQFKRLCLQYGGRYARGECHIGNYAFTHHFNVLSLLKENNCG
jgi:hypothetical protein